MHGLGETGVCDGSQGTAHQVYAALERVESADSLVTCDIVYAEICGRFSAQRECDSFLDSNEIRVEALTREAHFLASGAWRAYRVQGGSRTRTLADFMIGAHATVQANRLLSRDREFYGKRYPKLKLIDPLKSR